ncbi:hypothetical protein ABZ953_06585 [Streptomyces sp. NPDC046465]|uniref:hypothetical protein n=1 Tax=Streptomyces sp. NPDC046465 TaxID=3155810 RepID=UPI0033F973A8
MSAYDRLMAEALPTGTFGHAESVVPRRTVQSARWTAVEQAAHVAALEAELERLESRGTGKPELRLVENEAA